MHQDEAADDGVERLIERQLGRIAFAKCHIAQALAGGARPRRGDRRGHPVRPDDSAAVTDQLGCQEGNIACAAADIENAHAGTEPRGLKNLPRKRLELARLVAETLELTLRMTKDIVDCRALDPVHALLSPWPRRTATAELAAVYVP
jgi:hypothetical protein